MPVVYHEVLFSFFQIFRKALEEPQYNSLYAQLCRRLSDSAPNKDVQQLFIVCTENDYWRFSIFVRFSSAFYLLKFKMFTNEEAKFLKVNNKLEKTKSVGVKVVK